MASGFETARRGGVLACGVARPAPDSMSTDTRATTRLRLGERFVFGRERDAALHREQVLGGFSCLLDGIDESTLISVRARVFVMPEALAAQAFPAHPVACDEAPYAAQKLAAVPRSAKAAQSVVFIYLS